MKYTGLFLDSPVFIIKKPENSLEKSRCYLPTFLEVGKIWKKELKTIY